MNNTAEIAHPPIVSEAEWLEARVRLLQREKENTRDYDRINAARRRLPMVKVEKEYVFEGPNGPLGLADLFEGQAQLIVHHFMFDPGWEKGCPGCTGFTNALGDISELERKSTKLVAVSRAPLAKLEEYQKAQGWTRPWYSCGDGDFNYDFHATLDPDRAPLSYNYKSGDELEKLFGKVDRKVETSGFSVFFRIGDDVYHTYSTFARGGESLSDAVRLLDITPYGRQQAFEDSPEGWPQRPTYG